VLILEQVAAFAELKISIETSFSGISFSKSTTWECRASGFRTWCLLIGNRGGVLSPWSYCNQRVRGNRREIPGLQSVAGKTLSGKELGVVFETLIRPC
jgi:hypothetical protein